MWNDFFLRWSTILQWTPRMIKNSSVDFTFGFFPNRFVTVKKKLSFPLNMRAVSKDTIRDINRSNLRKPSRQSSRMKAEHFWR